MGKISGSGGKFMAINLTIAVHCHVCLDKQLIHSTLFIEHGSGYPPFPPPNEFIGLLT